MITKLTKPTTRARKAAKPTPAEALADLSLTHDRLVDTREAARLLALTPKTLRSWRCERKGPAALKLGSGRRARVAYRLSSLEAWVRANVATVVGGDA